MNKTELIKQIFELCVIPLFGILTGFLINFIKVKNHDITERMHNEKVDKYMDMLSSTIQDCVVATNQTYVNALKEIGEFDADAQKEAFQRTYNAILSILSSEAKTYLSTIYGDLHTYITQKIEEQVYFEK